MSALSICRNRTEAKNTSTIYNNILSHVIFKGQPRHDEQLIGKDILIGIDEKNRDREERKRKRREEKKRKIRGMANNEVKYFHLSNFYIRTNNILI